MFKLRLETKFSTCNLTILLTTNWGCTCITKLYTFKNRPVLFRKWGCELISSTSSYSFWNVLYWAILLITPVLHDLRGFAAIFSFKINDWYKSNNLNVSSKPSSQGTPHPVTLQSSTRIHYSHMVTVALPIHATHVPLSCYTCSYTNWI